jgi:hypothetical protein
MQHHLNEDDLVLHYYGEMDGAEEAHAAAHIAECAACHASYTKLQRVLSLVETAPVPVLPESFERTVWARLEPALQPRGGWFSWFVHSPARLAWAAAVVVLVAGAFFAGRISHEPNDRARLAQSADALRERLLLVDLTEHLDRSQTMLVELVTAGGDGAVDISLERGRAEQLVAANRLYRQAARDNGDTAIADLLDELERVLVDVASAPEEIEAEELDRIRTHIDARGLLFKVRVASDAARERQKTTVRARAGQSS